MHYEETAGVSSTASEAQFGDQTFRRWVLSYVFVESGQTAEQIDAVSREAFFNAVRMYSERKTEHASVVSALRSLWHGQLSTMEQRAHGALALKDRLGQIMRCATGIDDTATLRQYLEEELRRTILDHGNEAVKAIVDAVFSPNTGEELAADVLEVAASVEDPQTARYRKWLIERALKAHSAYLRSAAVASILEAADGDLIEPLIEALEIEDVVPLKREMQRVLNKVQSG
jgi:hypothetical protein